MDFVYKLVDSAKSNARMRPPLTESRLLGALAQLGERNTGSVEVSGSIPLGSTKILYL